MNPKKVIHGVVLISQLALGIPCLWLPKLKWFKKKKKKKPSCSKGIYVASGDLKANSHTSPLNHCLNPSICSTLASFLTDSFPLIYLSESLSKFCLFSLRKISLRKWMSCTQTDLTWLGWHSKCENVEITLQRE